MIDQSHTSPRTSTWRQFLGFTNGHQVAGAFLTSIAATLLTLTIAPVATLGTVALVSGMATLLVGGGVVLWDKDANPALRRVSATVTLAGAFLLFTAWAIFGVNQATGGGGDNALSPSSRIGAVGSVVVDQASTADGVR